jgi:opacity protein-like surface antigen
MKKTLLVLLVAATLAPAQVFEAGGFGGVTRLSNRDLGSLDTANPSNPDARVTLQNSWLFGLGMTINNWDHFGQEVRYAYHRTALQVGNDPTSQVGTAIHTVTYGLVAYATPEGSKFRPYATGGGGFSNFIFPGGSVSQGGGQNKYGFFYGGGIKYRPSEDRPFLLRFDIRQHQTGKPFNWPDAHGLVRRMEISLGLSYVL